MIQEFEETEFIKEIRKMMARSIAHFRKKHGMKPLSLEEIGQTDERTITYDFLRKNTSGNVPNCPTDWTNYFCHYGINQHLRDLRLAGHPEYTLQFLAETNYFAERQWKNNQLVTIPAWEEQLKESLVKIQAKYGKRKTQKLKDRLRIIDGDFS